MLETIDLSIKKEYLNIFLNKLWDNFSEKFGPVGCAHNHLKTKNSEIYEYRINWCTDQTPFSTTISFFHHTSDGLKKISINTKDKKTNNYSITYQKELINTIKITALNYLNPIKIQRYAKIKIFSSTKLSGNYIFKKSQITLISAKDGFDYIILPITSTHDSDIDAEVKEKSAFYLSILSLISLNVYKIDLHSTMLIYTAQQFNDEIKYVKETGIYFKDNEAEAIDISDFRTNGNCTSPKNTNTNEIEILTQKYQSKLIFPHYTDEIIILIINKHEYQQSCLRFHEALNFKKLINESYENTNLISYEIIAYVAAIEATLDNKKEFTEIKCSKCDNVTSKEEWKISKKFNELIKNNNENHSLLEVFKKLYEDRSKFVHTGKNLYSISANKKNRPMKIIGKSIESRCPDYYYNISEFTGYILRKSFYKKLTALN